MPLPPKRAKPAAKPAVTTKSSAPPENPQKKALEAARKNQVTIPTRDTYEAYKLGEGGQAMHAAITKLDLENASSSGIFTLVGTRAPQQPFVSDFQMEVRDLIQGAMRALAERRRLPRIEILRHVYAALTFFAPKEVLPTPVAAQVVAQEAMYAKWNPRYTDEFAMRAISEALGQAVALMQLSGSLGVNPHYVHSQDNMESVLRGYGEGLKSSSLAVAGAYNQAVANLRHFQMGIEAGYESIKREYFTRSAAGILGKFLPK